MLSETHSQPGDCCRAALEYAARGWEVFPAKISGKQKYSFKSKEFSGSAWGKTTDADQIRRDYLKWPDALLGVATGPDSGVFVVEADTLDGHGVDGIAALASLAEQNGGLPVTVEALSPTGSRHLWFRYPEGSDIGNLQGVVPGVDVRAAGGMVLVPPSRRAGYDTPYRWVNPPDQVEVAECPDWLLKILKQQRTRVPEDSSHPSGSVFPASGDPLTNAKPKADTDSDRLRITLSALDPDMANEPWVRVGMALYHQYDGDEEGFTLWDEWSASSHKYDARNIRDRWRSFEADLRTTDPVTVATIFRMAKEARRADVKKKTPLDRFIDRYVLIEHGNLVCDLQKPPHCAVSRLDEFRNATANVRHLVPAPTKSEPDREKLAPVHQAWMVDGDRKTAQGVRYDPSEPFFFQDGLWWVNEFHQPAFKDATGDTSVFHEHMAYLFPVERERTWFVDWIAFNIQRPQTRCKVTPLHVAVAHGTGRGWVVELMGRLLGQWNCTRTKMNTLCGEGSGGGFQDYLNKSLFCAIEEVREGGRRYGISDKTRDILESPYLEVNVKFGGKKTQPIFTNFFLMSNHPDALVITNEDRRVNVFSGPREVRDRHYYLRLYEWLEADGVAALHRELSARDLMDFDWQHSMKTPARARMISNNRTETETLFHEFLAAPPQPAMTFSQIVQAMTGLSERDAFETNVDEGQVLKLLQHHAQQADRMKVGGRKGKAVRPWVLDSKIASNANAIREVVAKGEL